jgi:hypothetical protein
MVKPESSDRRRAPLSAETAFVVHLTADGLDVAERLEGRVEHVVSGRSLRFGSASDLVSFMQQVLADASQLTENA